MLTYIKQRQISQRTFIKLFDLSNADELVLANIARWGWSVTEEAQCRLFGLHDKIAAIENFAQHKSFCPKAEALMFEQPDAEDLVSCYLKYKVLSESMHIRMLNLTNAEELMDKKYFIGLSNEAELYLVEMPNAGNLIRKYIQRYSFEPKTEIKLFARPDISEIISDYLANNRLYEENETLLFNLPNGVELMQQYLTKSKVTPETVKAIFNHPASEKILPTLLQNQEITPEAQKELLKHPNVVTLLPLYIEHHPLCEEAQMMLFDLPYTISNSMLHKYAVKQKFSLSVMQRLAVSCYFS